MVTLLDVPGANPAQPTSGNQPQGSRSGGDEANTSRAEYTNSDDQVGVRDRLIEVERRPVVDCGLLGLSQAQADFALRGGIAVTILVSPRMTKDIDLLVPGAGLAAVLQLARGCGFVAEALPLTCSRA